MVKSYVPDRGDFVWISLDPTLGHEQSGRRPVMIISSHIYNRTGLALVCPVTSKVKGYPFESKVGGRKIQGAVLSDQVRTIDWSMRNIAFIEKADSDFVEEVQAQLIKLIKA